MLRGRFLLVLFVALAIPMSAAAGTSGQSSIAREGSLEELVLHEINVVRASHGLGRLAASGGLTRAALRHSRSMVVNGYFAHESKNGAPFWKRVKVFYSPRSNGWTVGENLAMFGGMGPAAGAIVQSWMASPPHRANLLSRQFSEAGIAILHDPAAGGVYGGQSTWVVTLDVGAR
jgi:uncharacterized protein YkwD